MCGLKGAVAEDKDVCKTCENRLSAVEVNKYAWVATQTISDPCYICLEDIVKGDNVCTLICMHMYHGACIDDWFAQHNLCPLCDVKVGLG